MIFKKGHIVPRWCGVKTQDRKAQHCITFGCDVRIEICMCCLKVRASKAEA